MLVAVGVGVKVGVLVAVGEGVMVGVKVGLGWFNDNGRMNHAPVPSGTRPMA